VRHVREVLGLKFVGGVPTREIARRDWSGPIDGPFVGPDPPEAFRDELGPFRPYLRSGAFRDESGPFRPYSALA
jgi:hypothetical protein